MNLHRDILRLAVPSILANITVPLVGMVDIAVAGHLGATGGLSAAAFIGGISIGAMLFDMLYWNFGFLRAGTGGIAAQAYGRFHTGVDGAAADIAAVMRKNRRKGMKRGIDGVTGRRTGNTADLGKRIMAARNANYHK